jgi:hypothetical protein
MLTNIFLEETLADSLPTDDSLLLSESSGTPYVSVTVTKFSPPKNSLFGILTRSESQNGNYEMAKNS